MPESLERVRDLDFVSIGGGVLEMGSSLDEVENCVAYWGSRLIDPSYRSSFRDWIRKEYPKHRVRIEPFLIGRFPVTNGQYAEFVKATSHAVPESLGAGSPLNHPVWGVSWEDASAFTDWLTERFGAGLRLPSEAEWEYSARGPSGTEFPFGDEFDVSKCNTVEAGAGGTTPVDQYPQGASAFGVFDLAGNVEEWTSDFYAPYPGGEFIQDDLSRQCGRSYRVLRGGSFALGGDLARCARRHGPHPGPAFRYRGFRVAQSHKP